MVYGHGVALYVLSALCMHFRWFNYFENQPGPQTQPQYDFF